MWTQRPKSDKWPLEVGEGASLSVTFLGQYGARPVMLLAHEGNASPLVQGGVFTWLSSGVEHCLRAPALQVAPSQCEASVLHGPRQHAFFITVHALHRLVPVSPIGLRLKCLFSVTYLRL